MRQKGTHHNDFIVSHIGKPIKRKKAATACGVLSLLILTTAGINMAMADHAWSESDTIRPLDKPALIIPRSMQDHDLYAEVQPESFESYQIRILRNQNSLQADKIRALRDEIMELTRKIHELTPHLFKQGDPADQEKIAHLSVKLGEKEQELDRLLEQKQQMELEHAQAKKKLNEMETVKEALTAMIDKQRSIKEQNSLEFRKQIEELRTIASAEKSNLLRKIQEHESIQDRLNGEMAEKAQTILRLDTVATQQDYMLSVREEHINKLNEQILALYDELLATSASYIAQQQTAHEQIHSLVHALDWEQIHADHLHNFKDKMGWISDLYEVSNTFLNNEIDSLKKQLDEQQAVNQELHLVKSELDSRKLELAWLLEAHADYKTEANAYLQVLAEALDLEQNQSKNYSEMIGGLLLHLENAETTLEYNDELQTKLEEVLAAMTLLLDDRRQKVSELEESLVEAVSNHEREQLIVSTLQLEIAAYKEILEQQELKIQTLTNNQVAESEVTNHYLTYYANRLDDAIATSYQLEMVLEDSNVLAAQAYQEVILELGEKAELLLHASGKNETLEADNQALHEENLTFKQTLAPYEELKLQNEHLDQSIAKLQKELEAEKAMNAAHAYEEIAQDLHEKIALLLLAYEENLTLEATNQALRDENIVLQQNLAPFEELKLQNNHKDESIAKLQNELVAEKAINAAHAYQGIAQEINEKMNLLSFAHEKNEALESDLQTLHDENAALKLTVVSFEELKQQNEQKEQLIARLHAELETEKAINAVNAHQEIAQELNEKTELLLLAHEKNESLESSLKTLTEEYLTLKENVSPLEEFKLQNDHNEQVIAKLQSELEAERAINAAHAYQEIAQELSEKAGELLLAHEKNESLESSLKTVYEENLILKENMSPLEDLKLQNEHHEQAIAKLQTELEAERAINAAHAYQEIAQELLEKERLLQLAYERNETLETDVQALDKVNVNLNEHLNRLEEWKLQNEQKDQDIAKLTALLETEKAINTGLQNDLGYARMNFVQEQRSKRNLEQIYQEEQQKLTALENRLSEHISEIASKDESLSQTQISYEYLLMQLKELTKELNQ